MKDLRDPEDLTYLGFWDLVFGVGSLGCGIEKFERLVEEFGVAAGSPLVIVYLGLVGSRRSAVKAENAQETPIQSHISPSILVHEDKC